VDVPQIVWWLTIAGITGLLLFEFVAHVRKAHVPTPREAGLWSAVYVGIAIVFGFGVLVAGGATMGRSTVRLGLLHLRRHPAGHRWESAQAVG
jgi:tellurite resistance protein TerC